MPVGISTLEARLITGVYYCRLTQHCCHLCLTALAILPLTPYAVITGLKLQPTR